MIYTVTLNPSVDYHIWLSALEEGGVHLVEREAKVAGGKGVNVSLVLKRLGRDSTALGFVGGFTGAFIRQKLEKQGIATSFLEVDGDTRINIKIKAGQETEVNGLSPFIPKETVARLFDQLRRLGPDDSLVLAGSIPASVGPDVYAEMLRLVSGSGVTVYLDTHGKALLHSLSARPFLIKPNHHELGEVFDVVIDTPEEALIYARKLAEAGAQNVIVSLAGAGAVFTDGQKSYIATVPKGEVKNSTGAGDSVVAGFLHEWERTRDKAAAFRFGVAAGSATAFSDGFCTPESIARLLPDVHIKQA